MNWKNVAYDLPFRYERLAKMQRMRREISTSISWSIHIQPRNIFLPICNNITFKKQKPYFCNTKTPFLHAKNHTFARQKPYFCFSLV